MFNQYQVVPAVILKNAGTDKGFEIMESWEKASADYVVAVGALAKVGVGQTVSVKADGPFDTYKKSVSLKRVWERRRDEAIDRMQALENYAKITFPQVEAYEPGVGAPNPNLFSLLVAMAN